MTSIQNVSAVQVQQPLAVLKKDNVYSVNFKSSDQFVRQPSLQEQQIKMLQKQKRDQNRQKAGRTVLNVLIGLAMTAMIIAYWPMVKKVLSKGGEGGKTNSKGFIEQFKDLTKDKKIVSIENESIDETFRKFANEVKESANAPKEILEFVGDEATDNMIILCGRSGYGKTYDADVLFKELGAHRVKRQFSNWSSKYVGETAVNVTEFYNNLEKILKENPDKRFGMVLDEADSLFTPLEKISGDHAYLKETRSAILNGIDQVRKYPNFFMVATTNAEMAPGELDEAIVRRFAHNYTIKAPNIKALIASFKTHFTGYKGAENLFNDATLEAFIKELNQRGAGHGDVENIAKTAKTQWKAKMVQMGKDAGYIDKSTGKVIDTVQFNKLMVDNPITAKDLQAALDSIGKLAIEVRQPPKSMVQEIPNKFAAAYQEALQNSTPEKMQELMKQIISILRGQS